MKTSLYGHPAGFGLPVKEVTFFRHFIHCHSPKLILVFCQLCKAILVS